MTYLSALMICGKPLRPSFSAAGVSTSRIFAAGAIVCAHSTSSVVSPAAPVRATAQIPGNMLTRGPLPARSTPQAYLTSRRYLPARANHAVPAAADNNGRGTVGLRRSDQPLISGDQGLFGAAPAPRRTTELLGGPAAGPSGSAGPAGHRRPRGRCPRRR